VRLAGQSGGGVGSVVRHPAGSKGLGALARSAGLLGLVATLLAQRRHCSSASALQALPGGLAVALPNGTGDGLPLARWKATDPVAGFGGLPCVPSLAVSLVVGLAGPLLAADAGRGLGIGPIRAEVAQAPAPSGSETQRCGDLLKLEAALCN